MKMIDGLIAGKLYGTPRSRTRQSRKAFLTATVRAAASDGESLLVNVIAFSQTAQDGLLALGVGDSVTLARTVTPKGGADKCGKAKARHSALQVVAT